MSDEAVARSATQTDLTQSLTDDQLVQAWTHVAPTHPALKRVHQKLNSSVGAEASITSYDRMHHRHNRS